MSTSQPFAQVLRGLVWSVSVERHQRSRHTRDAYDVGPPAVSIDGRYLDQIRVSPNGFFEVMDDGTQSRGCGCYMDLGWRKAVIVRARRVRSSEATDEGRSTCATDDDHSV